MTLPAIHRLTAALALSLAGPCAMAQDAPADPVPDAAQEESPAGSTQSGAPLIDAVLEPMTGIFPRSAKGASCAWPSPPIR